MVKEMNQRVNFLFQMDTSQFVFLDTTHKCFFCLLMAIILGSEHSGDNRIEEGHSLWNSVVKDNF